jgi:opacity protein-like surface antigen
MFREPRDSLEGLLVTIISIRRLSLLAAGASLAMLAAAAPAAAQESYWNGWYLGANAGASWGDNKLSRQIAGAGGAVVIPQVDITRINGGTTSGSNKTEFTGGIEGGYNYHEGNWLFGIEADWIYLKSDTRRTNSFTSAITQPINPPPPPVTYSVSSRAETNDWMASLRPRIGWVSGSGPWLV